MKNKKLIRLTESDLRRIVKESVNRVLNEIGDTKRGQYHLGRAAITKIITMVFQIMHIAKEN